MKRFTLYIFFLICSVFVTKSFAQADISMATHWYNRANYNPASITRPDYIYLFSNVRDQWTGINGSPKVLNIQASELIYNYHSAVGISLVSDQIGVTQAINPMFSYAYRLGKDDDWALSMGLSIGVFSRSVNGSLFEAVNQIDPSLYTNLETTTQPDANVGVEYLSQNWVLGLSSTHLFSIGKTDNSFLNSNHVYGYAIYKNTNSVLFNYNMGVQLINRSNLTVVEGNASVRFKHSTGLTTGPREIFDVGLTYSTSSQLTLLLGLNISSIFRVGYAFSQSFSVGYSQNSTHEIMLEYRIPSKAASSCHCMGESYWYY